MAAHQDASLPTTGHVSQMRAYGCVNPTCIGVARAAGQRDGGQAWPYGPEHPAPVSANCVQRSSVVFRGGRAQWPVIRNDGACGGLPLDA